MMPLHINFLMLAVLFFNKKYIYKMRMCQKRKTMPLTHYNINEALIGGGAEL